MPECFLRPFAPETHRACSGRLRKCHLIDQAWLRREFPHGLVRIFDHIGWERATRRAPAEGDRTVPWRPLGELLWDDRSWVWGCGGPMGNAGHHGMFDTPAVNVLRVPRAALPAGLEEFAVELGPRAEAWLDRKYGPKEVDDGDAS